MWPTCCNVCSGSRKASSGSESFNRKTIQTKKLVQRTDQKQKQWCRGKKPKGVTDIRQVIKEVMESRWVCVTMVAGVRYNEQPGDLEAGERSYVTVPPPRRTAPAAGPQPPGADRSLSIPLRYRNTSSQLRQGNLSNPQSHGNPERAARLPREQRGSTCDSCVHELTCTVCVTDRCTHTHTHTHTTCSCF